MKYKHFNYIVCILIILILFTVFHYWINYFCKSNEYFDSTMSNEAVQNIASVYNDQNLIITDLTVTRNLNVGGNTAIVGKLNVSGDTSLTKLNISGDTSLKKLNVSGDTSITGNTSIAGNINVSGEGKLKNKNIIKQDDALKLSNRNQYLRLCGSSGSAFGCLGDPIIATADADTTGDKYKWTLS